MLKVKQFILGGCCTYLVIDEETKETAVIDPVFGLGDMLDLIIDEYELNIVAIAETHKHQDHASDVLSLKNQFSAKVYLSSKCESCRKDFSLEDGDKIKLGDSSLTVAALPGHSEDSVIFLGDGFVLTGDTLHVNSTGRTDFETGDPGLLYDGIKNKILTLPQQTVVFPGHSYARRLFSTVQYENISNSEITGRSRDEYIKLKQSQTSPESYKIEKEMLKFNSSAEIVPDESLKSRCSLSSAVSNDEMEYVDGRRPESVPYEVSNYDALKKSGSSNSELIDIREQFEVDITSIPAAKHIPMSDLGCLFLKFDRNKHYYFLCASGNRSLSAARTLRALGFKCYTVKGGVEHWRAEGLEVV